MIPLFCLRGGGPDISNMNDLVSVIIPCYNSERTLERVFRSLLLQTYEKWEAVFVDDGSCDRTEKVIRAFIRENPDREIRYVYQEHKGVSSARNRGLGISRGKHIAFLDSDDIWHVDKLKVQLNFMTKNGFLASGSEHGIIKSSEADQAIMSKLPETMEFKTVKWPGILFKTPFCTPSVMLNSALRNFLFDEGLSSAEDYDLWKRIAYRHSMAKIPHNLVYTCKHNYLDMSGCLSSNIFEVQKNIFISDIKLLCSGIYPLKTRAVIVFAMVFNCVKFVYRCALWVIFILSKRLNRESISGSRRRYETQT